MQLMPRSLVAVTLAVVVVAVGVPAGAARPQRPAARPQRPPAGPQLTAKPVAAAPGQAVVLRGTGFPRNAPIELLAGPPRSEARSIGSARTGRRGGFVATIRIRSQADPGRLVALACHDACRVKAAVRFRIVAR
jgi:hypothetical protein